VLRIRETHIIKLVCVFIYQRRLDNSRFFVLKNNGIFILIYVYKKSMQLSACVFAPTDFAWSIFFLVLLMKPQIHLHVNNIIETLPCTQYVSININWLTLFPPPLLCFARKTRRRRRGRMFYWANTTHSFSIYQWANKGLSLTYFHTPMETIFNCMCASIEMCLEPRTVITLDSEKLLVKLMFVYPCDMYSNWPVSHVRVISLFRPYQVWSKGEMEIEIFSVFLFIKNILDLTIF
jgi:hypothetical protein